VLAESYRITQALFVTFGMEVSHVMENRLDYCWHTNAILTPEKVLSEKNLKLNLKTRLTKKFSVDEIEILDEDDPDYIEGGIRFRKSYLSLGNRKANNYYFRIYNKAEEVIKLGYKGFFFDLWYKNMLISFYDKYCYEYAYSQKDYNAIYKAMLMFYLVYGTKDNVKSEFRLTLQDPKTTYAALKKLALSYMPKLTTIMNIEFETKRNFYRHSDTFIDQILLPINMEGMPKQLERLVTILDNKATFIEWLSRGGVAFVEDNRLKLENEHLNSGEEGREKEGREREKERREETAPTKFTKYLPWWSRMRATKLKDSQTSQMLIRQYNHHLDKHAVLHKLINQAETYAAQNEVFDSDIDEAVLDMLANINDNDMHSFHQDLRRRQEFFNVNVHKKHRRIKNRLPR
jgi:hypothetical protein